MASTGARPNSKQFREAGRLITWQLGLHATSHSGGRTGARSVQLSRVEEGRGTEQPYGRPTRFPSPLIKPDVPVSGIRLSDRLHQRLTDAAPGEHRAVATRPNPRTQPSPRIW